MYYFVVLSPRSEDYEEIKEVVLKYMLRVSSRKLLVVEEHGKQENHPHLNIVYDDKVKDVRNVYRKWYKIFSDEILKRNSRLLSIKEIYDEVKLTRGYLQKEANAKILMNKGFRQSKSEGQKKTRELMNEVLGLCREIRQIQEDDPKPYTIVRQNELKNFYIKFKIANAVQTSDE